MSSAAFVTALLAGLTGSGHCLLMCGGYVAAAGAGAHTERSTPAADAGAQPAAPRVRSVPLLPARRLMQARAVMQAGRLSTYLALGGLLGAAGGAAFALSWPAWQRGLYAAANVTLLLAAGAMAGAALPVGAAERAGLGVFRRALPLARPWLAARGQRGHFAAGAMWGLTPCALIYAVAPLALLSGGPLAGAVVMLGLWLGTLPALLLAGTMLRALAVHLGARGVRLTAAAIVAVFALGGLWRALALPALRLGPLCLGA